MFDISLLGGIIGALLLAWFGLLGYGVFRLLAWGNGWVTRRTGVNPARKLLKLAALAGVVGLFGFLGVLLLQNPDVLLAIAVTVGALVAVAVIIFGLAWLVEKVPPWFAQRRGLSVEDAKKRLGHIITVSIWVIVGVPVVLISLFKLWRDRDVLLLGLLLVGAIIAGLVVFAGLILALMRLHEMARARLGFGLGRVAVVLVALGALGLVLFTSIGGVVAAIVQARLPALFAWLRQVGPVILAVVAAIVALVFVRRYLIQHPKAAERVSTVVGWAFVAGIVLVMIAGVGLTLITIWQELLFLIAFYVAIGLLYVLSLGVVQLSVVVRNRSGRSLWTWGARLLLVPLIFAAVDFGAQTSEFIFRLTEGQIVDGTILDKQPAGLLFEVSYQYDPNFGDPPDVRTGTQMVSEAFYDRFDAGDSVPIYFLDADRDVSSVTLVTDSIETLMWTVIFGLAASLWAVGLVLIGRRRAAANDAALPAAYPAPAQRVMYSE